MTSVAAAPSRALRAQILTPESRSRAASTSGSDQRAAPLRYLEDGLLTITDDGRIVEVAPWAPREGLDVVDLRPAVVLPGFVDAHVHFPQARIVGSASGPLLEWLERSVFPEEARFADVAYARTVATELVRSMLGAGTTLAAVFSSSHPLATNVLFEELARSGMRAFAGLTLMDRACPEELRLPLEPALAACAELAGRWDGHDRGRLRFAVTPRFAISCTRPLLEAAARFAADHRLWVQTHVSENAREGAETLEVHPWGRDYLDVYDRVGLVGSRTLLAHAIHVSPAEWDRMAHRGARVAHCPDSNFFLGSGRMRLHDATSRGVEVALGTDVAAGRTFSLRRVMASAYDNALCIDQRVSPATLFHMATLGGAAALGLDAVTGSLEPGKEADLVVLDLPDHVRGESSVLSHVVFASDVTRVRRVAVRGQWLLPDD
jgi:guanine deaminase